MATGIEPSLIADSDGVGIVILTMGSHYGFGTALMDAAITFHIVVVADVFPTTVVLMIVAALLKAIMATEQCCTTMKDY